MPTVSQPGLFTLQVLTSTGAPAANYRLYTYTAGTTTHKVAYTDSAGAVAHTYSSDGIGGEYIPLDARGELPAPLWLQSGAYDIALKTAAGATVWTRYTEGQSDTTSLRTELATATDTNGADLVGYLSGIAGAVATTVWDYLRSIESVFRTTRVDAGGGANVYADASLKANRVIDSHAYYGFLDVSQISYTGGGTIGHASYADNVVFSGSTASDHHNSYQSIPYYGTAATIGRISSFYSHPDTTAGTVTVMSGFHMDNPTSAGTITTLYGMYLDDLTRGATNWAVFTRGDTPSFFGGKVWLGTGVTGYASIDYATDGALEIASRATYPIRLIADDVIIGDSGDASAARIGTGSGNMVLTPRSTYGLVVANLPGTATTLTVNSSLTFTLTTDLNLRISVRGSDGVTRVANITLA